MNPETPNQSADKKKAKDEKQTEEKSVLKDAVDPRDLVMKGGYTKDPKEIVQNPAVTPQMLNEPGDLRDDLEGD